MINTARLLKEFVDLVSIDSPSYGERQMGDYLIGKLQRYGFDIIEDDAGEKLNGNCGNIYGYLPGNSYLEPLLFCVHMDTVEPATGKVAIVEDDGTIHSGGDTILGADDFSGIAAILEALETIIETGENHRPIEVLITVAEEVYCKGAKVFDYSIIKSREAYVLDLTGDVGTAAYQAPTIISFGIDIKGKAAHAGFAPHKGVHAIKVAADSISKLSLGRVDKDTTLNIGMIAGGLATNIIPEDCTVQGEIRSYSHDKALNVLAEVHAEFERAAGLLGATLRYDVTTNCQAYKTPLNHTVVKRFEAVCNKLDLPFSLVETFGGSDNNVLSEHGIIGIVLACAMNGCHSCGEYTTVDELTRIAEVTRELMISGVKEG